MLAAEVVVCKPVRTAIGTYGGTLQGYARRTDVGAVAIRATLEQAKLVGQGILTPSSWAT